jgi:hypothetical protein
MRTVIVAVIVGLAGVVAASTFALSLRRLTDDPKRYGWPADFTIVDATNQVHEPFVNNLVRDARVEAIALASGAPVQVDGETVAGYALEPRKGFVEWTVARGRMPSRPGEVMLGPRFANQIGADLGSTVRVSARGIDVPVRVVGIGIGPTLQNERLGRQVLLRKTQFDSIARDTASSDALVRLAPGVDVERFTEQLAGAVELAPRTAPAEVRNLEQLGLLPLALAAFLAGVALLALVHGLVSTLRRQARDIAVLRTLGLTPRQARGSVIVAALVVVGIGVLVGVPLGLALGRMIWAAVASVTSVGTAISTPSTVLLLLAPAAAGIALIAALLPGERAATMRPASVLRAE